MYFSQAIDIWMGACTGFIFAALLEFTFTNYLWRKGQKFRLTQEQREASKKGGFGPVAAAATAAVSGFDPTMFTQMMAAGAVAGNATIEDGGRHKKYFEREDDQIPLTSSSPAQHDLLKQRRSQFPKMKSFEMQPPTVSMRRAFSMDNYANLESAELPATMNNTTNGHSHSYVDTEVSTILHLMPCIRVPDETRIQVPIQPLIVLIKLTQIMAKDFSGK